MLINISNVATPLHKQTVKKLIRKLSYIIASYVQLYSC